MNIREIRISQNLSTREAARLAGMEPIAWNQIERGNCLPSDKDRAAIIGVLGSVRFFSEDDVNAKREANKVTSSHMAEARSRINLTSGGAKPSSGTCKCPACGPGHLRFSIASNGHVTAQCSTEGCLCWME